MKNPLWIYLLSLISLLVLAIFSVGWLHPDEHFQILEFARWKIDPGGTAPLPWEFHHRMRPAFQPALVVALSGVFSLAGEGDPFLLALILRLLTAALSFVALWMIYRRYIGEITDPMLNKQFLLMSFLLWFTQYLAVRYSSETWSGALFVIAFTLPFTGRTSGTLRFLAAGLLLGCAFIVRYQAGLLVAGFLLWLLFVRKEKWKHLLVLAAGFLAAAAAGVLIDRWFYGEWVLTAWNYFEQNLVADKISGFGVYPWHFYFTELFSELIPPFSLFILAAFLLVFLFRRNDALTWTLLPFILVHFAIGHKETRFFFPLMWFVPVVMIKGAEIISARFGSGWMRTRVSGVFMTVFWVVNLTLLATLFFIPADRHVALYQWLYRHGRGSALYYMKENPYQRALEVAFYRNSRLACVEVEDVAALDSVKGRCFLAVNTPNPDMSKLKSKKAHLVWSSFPESVKYINVNHWVERTKCWYVFRLE